MAESRFPGFDDVSNKVYSFIEGHYAVHPDCSNVHGDFQVDGQSGNMTHYHVFEPQVGYGEHVILRLNTVLLSNIQDVQAGLNFVNFANQELSHSACLSHLIFRQGSSNFIMSASQTVLLDYDHNLFHDIFSNHIHNNHWYISLAENGGLPRGFEVDVEYEFGDSSGS
jgi:hypothetical protein